MHSFGDAEFRVLTMFTQSCCGVGANVAAAVLGPGPAKLCPTACGLCSAVGFCDCEATKPAPVVCVDTACKVCRAFFPSVRRVNETSTGRCSVFTIFSLMAPSLPPHPPRTAEAEVACPRLAATLVLGLEREELLGFVV